MDFSKNRAYFELSSTVNAEQTIKINVAESDSLFLADTEYLQGDNWLVDADSLQITHATNVGCIRYWTYPGDFDVAELKSAFVFGGEGDFIHEYTNDELQALIDYIDEDGWHHYVDTDDHNIIESPDGITYLCDENERMLGVYTNREFKNVNEYGLVRCSLTTDSYWGDILVPKDFEYDDFASTAAIFMDIPDDNSGNMYKLYSSGTELYGLTDESGEIFVKNGVHFYKTADEVFDYHSNVLEGFGDTYAYGAYCSIDDDKVVHARIEATLVFFNQLDEEDCFNLLYTAIAPDILEQDVYMTAVD